MSTAPRRLGKYELQEQLGRGQHGEVWKARDLALHRDAAIKILHSDLQSDPHFLHRFTSDGPLLSALQHKNIVPIHETTVKRSAETSETTAYIAMDYVAGHTLADLLQATSHRGSFPSITNILYLFTCIGSAIDHVHQQGLIHGNLKPANILLNKADITQFPAGEPLLTDVGIAQIVGNLNFNPIPTYMSPEQAQGLPITKNSDIYALGIILYEICTGIVPFRDENPIAVMTKHIHTLPTPPKLINANIPSELSEVILRAMSKDPASRYHTATYLAYAIADACSPQPTQRVSIPLLPPPTQQTPKPQQMQSILGVSQPLINDVPQYTLRPDNVQKLPTHLAASFAQPQVQTSNVDTPPPIPTKQNNQMTSLSGMSNPPSLHSKKIPLVKLPTRSADSLPGQVVPNFNNSLPGIPETPAQTFNKDHLLPATNTPTAYIAEKGPIYTRPQPISSPLPPPLPIPKAPHNKATTLFNINKYPPYMVIVAIVVLLFLIGGGTGLTFLLNKPSASSTLTGSVFLQDNALARGNQLRIEFTNLPAPENGQQYVAWIQNAEQQVRPLGALPFDNGKVSFVYKAENKEHLLAFVQRVFVTKENSQAIPETPGHIVYQAAYDTTTLPAIKSILYQTPALDNKESALVSLFEAIKSINDKAVSVSDSLQNTGDIKLAQRQATRIIEIVDGSKYATESGDRPPNRPSQLSIKRGLLSSPDQPGYIEILEKDIDTLLSISSNQPELRKRAQHVKNAIINLKEWIQTLREETVIILKADNLADDKVKDTALQLKQLASDCYIGNTIPPNTNPQPTIGSAGAVQAYNEALYLASLQLK